MSHLKSSREIISENFVNKKFFENFLSIVEAREGAKTILRNQFRQKCEKGKVFN